MWNNASNGHSPYAVARRGCGDVIDKQKKNRMANKHLMKLWILTLLVAPFVYPIYELLVGVEGQVVTLIEVLPITLIFSIIFSLPTLLIAIFINKLTYKKNISNRIRKSINISIAVLGLICTLLIIKGSLIPTLIKIYFISTIISAIIIETFLTPKSEKHKAKTN